MKDPRFAKFVLGVNAVVPLALLIWDSFRGQLGANPGEFVLRTTGMLTLIFLLLSLAVTPIRKITGKNWLSHFRRMIGLYAFFYGCLHLLTYTGFEKSFDFADVLHDTLKRPFIMAGMGAFLLLIPLAITSTNKMIKRLGAKRWKRLHQAVYVAAGLGALHYWLLVKADVSKPLAFAAVLGLLLGYRAYSALRKPAAPAAKPLSA